MSTLSPGAVRKRLGRWSVPVEVHGDGRFVVSAREFVPAYLRAHEEGRLREKIDEAIEALRTCTLCPRNCRVNRLEGKFGVCKVARHARVSAHFPHFGEEDVLRGWSGSGTIFMSWCNLRCVFCLHPDVPVLTDQGMQRIEDIFARGADEVELDGGKVRFVRGLRAWTRQGKPAVISKAFSHPYRGEMVVIKPYGLPALVATPNHAIFAALEADGQVRKVPAGELTTSHHLLVPKPRVVASPGELEVSDLLAPHVATIRRSAHRRVPAAVLSELAATSASAGPTSREIGAQLGVFPYSYATSRNHHQTIEGRAVRQSETLYYVKWRRGAGKGSETNGRLGYRGTEEAFLVPIRRISRVPYDGPVYNLEVADEDHSYIASGVAVGNCQNFETSQIGEGEDVGPRDLARMILALQARGCHNINFVTPEHVVPQILEALPHAIEGGLRLPIVYNTSAYDSLHSIGLMDGVADIYMPDFKLWDRERCRRYLLAPDYADTAREVIRAMHAQVGPLTVNEDGLAMRGLLVRHLVMPGMLEDTREILGYLAQLSRDTYVNVMGQYYPAWKAKTNPNYEEINRHIEPEEMEAACAHARAAGLWRLDRRWRRIAAGRWL